VFAAFPDATDTIDDIVAEDDRVAVRHTFRGTHKGEFLGIPPSGHEVIGQGLYITRLAEGRIVEMWVALDLAASARKSASAPKP
jgi:predicted ester cyclase